MQTVEPKNMGVNEKRRETRPWYDHICELDSVGHGRVPRVGSNCSIYRVVREDYSWLLPMLDQSIEFCEPSDGVLCGAQANSK